MVKDIGIDDYDDRAKAHLSIHVVRKALDRRAKIAITDRRIVAQSRELHTSAGTLRAFGEKRLSIIDLFVCLVNTGDADVREKCREVKILAACLDHFIAYQWNNLLHTSVLRMIEAVCTPSDMDGPHHRLFLSVGAVFWGGDMGRNAFS